MAIGYRTCKIKYDPLDGTGALERGGRWNSPGHAAIYASASYANTLLEIMVHLGHARLPGPHHAVRLEIPDPLVSHVHAGEVPGWDEPESASARDYGNAWLASRQSVALVVPTAAAQPFERNIVLNPGHPAFDRVVVVRRVLVVWERRLFQH